MLNNHSYPADKCTFELLSAYLDGEVTAKEREEVKQLLAEDKEAQKLYKRLLNLRHKFQSLPTPQPQYSANDLSQAVFARVDQENSKQRKRWLWGGSAIAALVVASISGIFSESRSPLLQMANNSQNQEEEHLIIALNEPLINLPNEQNERVQDSLNIPLSEPLFNDYKQ